MKNKLFLLIAFLLVATTSWGEDSDPKFEIAVEPALRMFPYTPNYGTGIGAGLFMGLRMDSQFSLGIEPGIYSVPCVSSSSTNPILNPNGGVNDLEFAVVLKERFGKGPVRFFLAGGGGFSIFSDNSSYDYQDFYGRHHVSRNLSETDPIFKFAAGLDFKMGEGASFSLPLGFDWISASNVNLISLTLQPGFDFTF